MRASENDAGRRRRPGYASAGADQMQSRFAGLFSVGDPDVLDLGGMLEEPAAFREFRVKPIDCATLVRPDLLQVSDGHRLRGRNRGFIAITPNAIDVVVFRQSLHQL